MNHEPTEIQGSLELVYSIRVLVRHPRSTTATITAELGVEPTYSWEASDPGRSDTMWAIETWTQGQRAFFDELRSVLDWLQGNQAFVGQVRLAGGKITLIAQLSGKSNIGDELGPETMARAAQLGVSIGVEVFPNLQFFGNGKQSKTDRDGLS